jgi:hypothetical protein
VLVPLHLRLATLISKGEKSLLGCIFKIVEFFAYIVNCNKK